MKYLEKEDLISVIHEGLMGQSVALATGIDLDDNAILNDIESKSIDFAISYISGTYNTDTIFDNTEPIRNGVLVQVIANIVVYRAVRRNAARKVPEDYIQLYTDAKKDLEKIQSGAMNLVGCPKVETTDDYGTTISPIYGNNTNDKYFI